MPIAAPSLFMVHAARAATAPCMAGPVSDNARPAGAPFAGRHFRFLCNRRFRRTATKRAEPCYLGTGVPERSSQPFEGDFMLSKKILAGLVALSCAAAPALAQELTGTLKKIKDTNTIVIGHRESSIPFSYLDDKQQPIGYAMDLCYKVVDAVKAELKMPNLKVALQPVTSGNRIPQLQAGNIDIECGSTTNSVERQKQVAFGPTYFVINVTAAVKRSSGIKSLADLNRKTISTTSGTTSVPLLKQYEKTKNIEIKEIYGKDHAESFLLMAQ